MNEIIEAIESLEPELQETLKKMILEFVRIHKEAEDGKV